MSSNSEHTKCSLLDGGGVRSRSGIGRFLGFGWVSGGLFWIFGGLLVGFCGFNRKV